MKKRKKYESFPFTVAIVSFICTHILCTCAMMSDHSFVLAFQHCNSMIRNRQNSRDWKFTNSALRVRDNSIVNDDDKAEEEDIRKLRSTISINNEMKLDQDEDDEKPKYRSRLQRLNQVQGKIKTTPTTKATKKKTAKLKKSTRNQPNSNKSKSSITSPTQMPFGLLGDFAIDEDYAIDSFLSGEYDRPFADDAAAPLPKHSPGQIVEIALTALRDLNIPTTDHGAAVFMRFCAPLSRQDRWGNTSGDINGWKAIMRGALTPTMLARRLRASEEFSVLLDWEQLDVTKGTKAVPNEMLGFESTVAFVNAALYFGDGIEPSMCQFTLKMFNGVWFIDSAVMNKREWFMDND